MAQIVEVRDGLGGGALVVDVRAGDRQPGAELAAVHDGGSGAECRNHLSQGVRQAVAEEDQTVGLLAQQHLRVLLLAGLLVAGVAQQDGIAGCGGGFFDTPDHLREERVGDVGDGDQDLVGAQGAERLGGQVGDVAQVNNRRPDPRARRLRHPLRRTQHPRDRRGGDPGAARNILYRGHCAESGGEGGRRQGLGVAYWFRR